jgi:hypothetical protein
MHSDLRVIDPIMTDRLHHPRHGYMVYDTLLATDPIQGPAADGGLQGFDDKLTYTFTLRDGLKWHDGTPVTGGRLRGVAAALGQARRHGPEADGLHRQPGGDRCQDHHA